MPLCSILQSLKVLWTSIREWIEIIFFLKGHGTSSAKYRPEFLDHFDQKEKEKAKNTEAQAENPPDLNSPAGQALQKQLEQIAGGQPVLQNNTSNPSKFQQCIAEGDLEFVMIQITDMLK